MRGDDLREVARAILAELPMSGDGTGHVADCGYDEDGPACGCASLPGRIRAILLDAHPTPSEPEATVERLARERHLWRTLGHEDLRGETSGEPEATVLEEWGVRWANGETTTEGRRRDWAEDEINRVAHNAKSTGWRFYRDRHPGVLLRRTRTTYADRVTEWEEVE